MTSSQGNAPSVVVMPYTPAGLQAKAAEAIVKAGRRPVMRVMRDDEAYWRLLSDLWAEGGDFAIVEHDVVVNPGTFDRFDACPEPWCWHSYPLYFGGAADTYGIPTMGCVRFRAGLMAEHPGLLEAAGAWQVNGYPARHYATLDVAIQWQLEQRGVEAHRHHPDAKHLHAYPADGVFSTGTLSHKGLTLTVGQGWDSVGSP